LGVTVVRDVLAVTVDAGIDGSTVSDNTVLITGTLQAPPNSAVSVGSHIGTVTFDGRFFINDVPLVSGTNNLVITLATQEGLTTTRNFTVIRNADPGIGVSVTESSGIAPFDTEFSVTGVDGPAPKYVEFDINGDGVVDFTLNGPAAAKVIVTISSPGYNRATVRVKDADGIVLYSATKVLYAVSSIAQSSFLTGIYTRMLDQLRSGELTGALTAFTEHAVPKYTAVFNALGADLVTAVDQLGTIRGCTMAPSIAEILLVRQDGAQLLGYEVQLLRGPDGIWRIDGM
ncbi:MAG: hypothetical protein ABI885_11310, partial [Gammaproteobacteria bacterium]